MPGNIRVSCAECNKDENGSGVSRGEREKRESFSAPEALNLSKMYSLSAIFFGLIFMLPIRFGEWPREM